MPEFEGQDDIDMEAFKQWKLRWNKNYTTSKEEKIRFEKFQENLRLEEANSGPSEPPWMALDTYADGIPFEQYKVEILGLEPDNPEERVFSDTDSEERELLIQGYGKVTYGVEDKDGKVQLKFFYSKNLDRPFADKDSWYFPPFDKGQSKEVRRSLSFLYRAMVRRSMLQPNGKVMMKTMTRKGSTP
ncbi:putative cathepsin propeptide inhibitor domain (I29), papain-like cysteine peptidase superfamily [Helianthus annuus]|nr:putative cathepsin propeptide inhibitor domain (I29), papain-like cysteine peptidase superfamily [Helianthus annuus]